MKCSVYIATSIDGFIARKDGSIDWLEITTVPDSREEENFLDFFEYTRSVDCMVMGRKSMETIASMNLKPDQWPYGKTKIIVLSKTVSEIPESLSKLTDQMDIFSGSIKELVEKLEGDGYQHAYIDGGKTIQSFLKEGLIQEMTVTVLPILIGEGIPLFGKLENDILLDKVSSTACSNNMIQNRFYLKNFSDVSD